MDKFIDLTENKCPHCGFYDLHDRDCDFAPPPKESPGLDKQVEGLDIEDILCDVAQVFDGWAADDPKNWTDHDKSVRKRLSELQGKVESIVKPLREKAERLKDHYECKMATPQRVSIIEEERDAAKKCGFCGSDDLVCGKAWKSEREKLEKEWDAAIKSKDNAYRERDCLVSALSKIWPSHLCRHSDEDVFWENDWRWIVCIHSSMGQMTWHIHDSELGMFQHLKPMDAHWDGHSTEEKYLRLASLKDGAGLKGG